MPLMPMVGAHQVGEPAPAPDALALPPIVVSNVPLPDGPGDRLGCGWAVLEIRPG